jgi:hypothetical protein
LAFKIWSGASIRKSNPQRERLEEDEKGHPLIISALIPQRQSSTTIDFGIRDSISGI